MAGGKIDILIEPDMRGFSSKLESGLQGTLGVVGKIGGAFGLALGAGELAKQIGQIGVSFDQQMNSLAAVSQATGAQLDAVRAKAQELGSDTSLTGTSANDAAAAMTELAKGGFTVEQSMSAARGTLQLAAAAQVDAATAATIQSQALQAFSLQAEDAGRVSDILAGAANASSAEMTDVAAALQQAGTVSNQFGVSIDDATTSIAMLANAGITGSDAGTLLKSALLAVTDQGKPAQAAIEELGLTIYDTNGKFVGMQSLMEQLQTASQAMTDEQYQAATATLFGSDAMRLAGVAAQQGGEGFDKLKQAVTRQGQAAEVAAAQTEGMPGALERLQNTAESAGQAVYDALSDHLVTAVDSGTAALERFGPIAAGTLGGLADILAPVAGTAIDLAGSFLELPTPILAAGAALAVSNWVGFPARMEKGTSAVRAFGQEMKLQQALAATTGQSVGRIGSAVATLEARIPTIGRMNEAFREASSAGMTLGKNSIRVGSEIGGMSKAFGTAKGSAQALGGVLKGSVAGGMELAKSGASGLIGALGGPWGLAITAATAAIGYLVQKHQEAKAAEAEHKAAQDELRGSLDQTTGAITEQTKQLIQKKLEESGAAAGARELGLAQSTVQDAINGNASAMREVQTATQGAVTSALEGSKTWQNLSDDFSKAGINAGDVTKAMLGNKDAMDKITSNPALRDQGMAASWEALKNELDDTAGSAIDLGREVGNLSGDLSKVKTEATQEQLNQFQESAANTRDVLGMIGDAIISMPTATTIVVDGGAVTDQTLEKLNSISEEIHAVRNIDGTVTVSLPEGQTVFETLESIGAQLGRIEDNGNQYISIGNNAPEVQALLTALGVQTETLPSGEVVISSNTDEQQQKLIDLGILTREEKSGKLTINSNLDTILGMAGQLDARNGKNTSETHTVWERTVRSTEYANSAGGTQSLSRAMQADGSVRRKAVDGWLSDQQAQIAMAGQYVTWAEDETEGESFIPHARSKRARSTQILAETAGIFGLALVDRGGNLVKRDGTNVAPLASSYMADGGVRTPGELLAYFRGENVAGQQASRSLEGADYVWAGYNWGDCSSTQGQGALFSVGQQADNGRYMATMNEAEQLGALGFKAGLGSGPRYAIGWFNGGAWGGHTAGTIFFADGSSVNVEMGGGRGNGQIGGQAAGAANSQFTDVAHIPLPDAGETATSESLSAPGITSTSVSGFTLSSGQSVSWGKAQEYYDQAYSYLKRNAKIYDTGGILPTGGFAFNAGPPERILPAGLTASFERSLEVLPAAAHDMLKAAQEMKAVAVLDTRQAESDVVGAGRRLGGDWLSQVEIVADAEQGLIDLRKQFAAETSDIAAAEKNLAEAKRDLSKSDRDAVEKISDKEKALAKAREDGDADKIAKAERDLADAREEAPQKAQDAAEKVTKAEQQLEEARDKVKDQSLRLEAAERAVAAARYQALADLATGFTKALAEGVGHVKAFFDEMARVAGIIDETRQTVSKLQMEQVSNALALMKANQDLQVKEWDIQTTRAAGLVSIAKAEADLQKARDAAAVKGSTSIEAMVGALDRFRRTGIFSVQDVASSVIANTAAVKAAEWAVSEARAQAALDQRVATHQQELAQLAVAEATLTQNATVAMLRLQTDALAKQTAQLYGLTANQATGASRGFGGIANLISGAGGILGGIATALAGFAAGGPLGAIPGALMALQGLGSAIKGGIDVAQNKDDIADAWSGMDTMSKLGLVLGIGGGAALTGGGAYLAQQYGPDAAVAGAQLGSAWMNATIGGLQYSIAGQIDKSQRDTADQVAALQALIDAQKAQLAGDRLALEARQLAERDALQASVDYAALMKQLVESSTKKEAEALAEAAEVAALRRDHMIQIAESQMQSMTQVTSALDALVAQAQARAQALNAGVSLPQFVLPEGEAFTRDQTQAMLEAAVAAYEQRLQQLENPAVDGLTYFTARA